MHAARRYVIRSTRSTKYRLQLIILFALISLLVLVLYIKREETIETYDEEHAEFYISSTKKMESIQNISRDKAKLSVSTGKSINCAYKNCPKLDDDVINVHIICHTHLDPGWLNSVDGYFFGIQYSRDEDNNGQAYKHSMPSVLTIFNNVMAALLENAERRFVMVEMSFIWRWWKRLDEDYKNIIRKLMNDGRIDIAGGSWASNDEAVSHYSAMIDQSTLGLRFLKNELRSCEQPAIAWQLDLFGHGKEINSLFAQMGYDAILFGRLDYQEKEQRTNEKTLQMVWKVNDNAPEDQRWLFTGILPNLYHPPETLALKSDTAGAYLRTSDTETIRESSSAYSQRLIEELKNQYERYNSTNLAVIYGGDFEYEDATQYFQNIDAIIETANKNQNVTQGKKRFRLHYSTPTCFVHALSQEKRSWPVREGDFMSYAHRAHAFWTGFYTSRPGIKFYERSLGALYQSMRQLSIYAKKVDFNSLFQLSETMALLQHHDTITGTSPVIQINDALQRMHQTEIKANILALSLYQQILTPSAKVNWTSPLIFCKLNESYCQPLANLNKFSAIIYNPSSVSNQIWLRIPVAKDQKISLDTDVVAKHSIDAQEIGIISLSSIFKEIPIKRIRNQLQELIVRVSVPPLSLQAVPFKVSQNPEILEVLPSAQASCSIENQYYTVKISESGIITSILIKGMNKEIDFQQNFSHYTSSTSDQYSHQASGLYVFRPFGTDPPKKISLQYFHCYKRKGYEEIIQVYARYVNQSIRLLDNSPYIEFDWVAGRLDMNVELVTSYYSKSIENKGHFYTDSSGRSLMKRIRDQRDGYRFQQSERSAGNYYPLVTGILIKDIKQDLQLTVMNDRAQGGGSIYDGQIEIMIHRRMVTDDSLGVSETLNEPGVDGKGLMIRGRHLVSLMKIDDGMKFYREHALKSVWRPVIAFRDDQDNEPLTYKTWSLLKSKLPPQVNILTIEPLSHEKNILTVLFRIENVYDRSEHSTLSKAVSIEIRDIFNNQEIIEIKEVLLAGNMYKSEAFHRLKWSIDSKHGTGSNDDSTSEFNGQTIHLNPMQIRSFIIKLKQQ